MSKGNHQVISEITQLYHPIATIFGSSTCKPNSKLYQFTEKIVAILVQQGYSIANGGYTGTMDAAAKAATQLGGTAIGITTTEITKVKPSKYLTVIYEQKSLMSRLEVLMEISDLFIYLPGSTGTLTELALTLDKQKLGLLPIKPNLLVGSTWHKVFDLLFVREDPLVPRSDWKLDQEVEENTFTLKSPNELKHIIQNIKKKNSS